MSKIILSIETSSSICGVSIIENGNLLGIAEKSIFRKHNENLAGFADKAIKKSNRSLGDIDAIAVSIGPGSFTGLRIGLGFAKGMAYALGLPIIPVPTLLSLAFSLREHQPFNGIAHSHSNKVFYQEFSWENSIPKIIGKAVAGEIERFSRNIQGGFQWNCAEIMSSHSEIKKAVPSAEFIGILASIFYEDWAIETPYDLVPDYIAPFKMKPGE